MGASHRAGTLRGVSLLRQLRDVVGLEHAFDDPDLLRSFSRDWTGRWECAPRLVVKPVSTAQVSDVVRICGESNTTVVTQGGNTGLVGGGIPTRSGSVLLSTARLQRLDPVDVSTRQVSVGAGVTIAHLHAHATAVGLDYAVDLAARDSATVGGTIATNAGGVRVVAYGDTRQQVLGVEAVLADGSVISHLGGLPKDSAGYDIGRLLVGSEGTLAVVTAARLRLVRPLPTDRQTALVGVVSIDEALSLLDQDDLLAAEFVADSAMDLVCRITGLVHPLRARWPLYVLIETATMPTLPSEADAVFDRRVWAYRERQTEAVSTLGVVHKLDVSVPLASLDECLRRLPELARPYDCYVFGHLAEGNLHIEIVGAAVNDEAADARILRAVADLGGSISAEHGIGRAKAQYLGLSRSSGELAAMTAIKKALDPSGLLNPGVLFT